MNLASLQRQFLGEVLASGLVPADASPGLRVYANNVRGQLVEALRETYERTERWLGGDRFAAIADAYVQTHPSAGWNLNAYGADFPAFVSMALPLPDPAAEIAGLDGALRDAFYGADLAPVTPQSLAVGDWEQAVFRFAPSLSVCSMHTNAAAIWSALASSTAPPQASLLPAPVAVRVWRKALTPQFTSMSACEAECLALASSGATFGALCQRLATPDPDADTATLAGQLLGDWLTDELIVGVTER